MIVVLGVPDRLRSNPSNLDKLVLAKGSVLRKMTYFCGVPGISETSLFFRRFADFVVQHFFVFRLPNKYYGGQKVWSDV